MSKTIVSNFAALPEVFLAFGSSTMPIGDWQNFGTKMPNLVFAALTAADTKAGKTYAHDMRQIVHRTIRKSRHLTNSRPPF